MSDAQGSVAPPMISISRPAYDQNAFDTTFHYTEPELITLCQATRHTCGKLCRSFPSCIGARLLALLPFVNTLKTYKLKEYLIPDILAGLSVGIVQIPQGLGFALLASLPPVYGLYSAFWQPLFYFFFSTSRHTSFATMALMSIILGASVDREFSNFSALRPAAGIQRNLSENATDVFDDELKKVAISSTITLLAGMIQLAMAIFRLGFMTRFMPLSFISGFTTAAAVHIATSQSKHLVGISPERFEGVFKLIHIWKDMINKRGDTNIPAIIISVISIIILVFIKEIINKRFKHKLPVPIPAELIVVVVATLISYFVDLNGNYKISIVGGVTRGFAIPAVPSLDIFQNVIVDAFVCAIMSFVVAISLAGVFTRKYKYHVDSNQELFAYGATHILSSFFHCFVGSSAPPRCFIYDSSGGKTSVAHLFSCLFLLLVILAIGPLFESLPNCALGSIIIVAIIPLFKQVKDLKKFWVVSKVDFCIWIFTMSSTVILDLPIGLVSGISFVVLINIAFSQQAKGYLLGSIGSPDIYVSTIQYPKAVKISRIRIFHFESTLYYATCQTFKQQLFKAVGRPHSLAPTQKPYIPCSSKDLEKSPDSRASSTYSLPEDMNKCQDAQTARHVYNHINVKGSDYDMRVIILDCSTMTFIDVMGLNTLWDLRNDYKAAGVDVVVAGCSPYLREKLSVAGMTGEQTDDPITIYPTIADAVRLESHEATMNTMHSGNIMMIY